MIPLALGLQGAMGIASGIIGHKKRKQEQKTAQAEFESSRAQYMNQDLSNPYANMENTMEDLTVNTQAADFAAQQQAGGMANIMGSMKGAAGGSGIAALAQSLAGQQAQNAQQASADIGRQEAGNQAAAAQMAGNLQTMERQGDVMSRNMKREQYSTELGMAMDRKGQADLARQEATQSLMSGIGNTIMGGVGLQASEGRAGSDSIFGDLLGLNTGG
jgi:hypothetical protein